MRLTKRQARYIWYCICEHGGYAENRDEWLENCGISEEEAEAFDSLVYDSVESITADSWGGARHA